MSTAIPFNSEVFRPLCVKGNAENESDPVIFELNAVGGASRARLRSMIAATSGLSDATDWSPIVQDAVIKAFETGPAVFVEGISNVRGLTAPAALCLKQGVIAELPPGVSPQTQIPIRNGYEFSRVCGFWPILTFEVAMAIARISGQAEIDPRFFDWLSTSAGMPASPLGTAERAERKPGKRGTVAKRTPRTES